MRIKSKVWTKTAFIATCSISLPFFARELSSKEFIPAPDSNTSTAYIKKVPLASDPTIKVEPPKVVEPKFKGEIEPAPEGAKILFDGSSFKGWKIRPRKGVEKKNPSWKLIDSDKAMEVVSPTGSITLIDPVLTEGHLHIEWATPAVVKGNGQGRGNSGVFIEGFPEVQVLDSYENFTDPDRQAGSLYKKSMPLVNACRKPGEWQCYDIYFKRSKVDPKTKKMTKGSLTVYHNKVLIQDAFQTKTKPGAGVLSMQDHNNPVRYRNIWFVEGKTKK